MSVSVVLVRALVEAVESAQLNGGEFLSAARFDPRRLEQADGRVAQAEYDALVERALDLTAEPALGLHMGAATRSLAYSLHAHMVLQATSIRQGLQLAEQYYRLFTDERPWHIEDGKRAAVIKLTASSGSLRCRRFSAEVAVAGFYRMVQHFSPDAQPELVAFEHAAPVHRAEYARVFRGTERFEQPFTGIVIDRARMDARQSNCDEELHSVLRMQAAKRLARLEQAATCADSVHEYVTAMPERSHDMSAVARALGMAPRSLRRRLAEEQLTFRQVVDRALASVAVRLLVDEKKSIQEASHEMAFSEPSAFCRAFKRWTGSTPKQYQADHALEPLN